MPMGRRRRPENDGLPPYTTFRRNEFIFRGYRGGKRLPQVVLVRGTREDTPLSDVWAEWEKVTGETEQRTLRWLWRQYKDSRRWQRLALSTRKDYEKRFEAIARTRTKAGGEFGDAIIYTITARTIRTYLDRRAENAPVAANRELALLRVLLGYAREYGYLTENPAAGIKGEQETSRERLVTPAEFWALHDHAPIEVQIAMRLAVGLRLRVSEVLALRWSAVDRDRGVIRVVRRKGSKTQDVTITGLLAGALELAKQQRTMGLEIVQMTAGGAYQRNSFKNRWQLAWRTLRDTAARDPNITVPERFTFHDLKAAGVSWADDPRAASGHKSARMTAVYDRRIRTVEGTDFEPRT